MTSGRTAASEPEIDLLVLSLPNGHQFQVNLRECASLWTSGCDQSKNLSVSQIPFPYVRVEATDADCVVNNIRVIAVVT